MNSWISRVMRHLSTGVATAAQDMSKFYEEAVRALNTLQSNAAVLEKSKKERDRNRHLNIPQTIVFAERAGVVPHLAEPPTVDDQYGSQLSLYKTDRNFRLSDLDELSVIHVSGTKGKGSTCAFCERILREHGFKTGFYSSPHLVEVRERIRINGRPLSREGFSSYFWDCFNKLEATKDSHGGTMPAYFRFLTIMAFHVFLQEKVDVAIIEVGIGGQYDCTNILRSPVVCGVSSLGIDHVGVLGNTLDKIAWQKAGIFKRGVPAVTVWQPDDALQVLIDRAKDIGSPLRMAPVLDEYMWNNQKLELGINGDMQKYNASLALQLCRTWMEDRHKDIVTRKQGHLAVLTENNQTFPRGTTFEITSKMATGLRSCQWPGRNQVLRRPRVTYFLDGAHTEESIQNCMSWFVRAIEKERSKISGRVIQVLLFNSTGERSARDLLKGISKTCRFDCAVFCPNIATSHNTADQTNFMVTFETQQTRVISNRNCWLELLSNKDTVTLDTSSIHQPLQEQQSAGSSTGEGSNKVAIGDVDRVAMGDADINEESLSPAYTFQSIQDALQWLSCGKDPMLPLATTMTTVLPRVIEEADHVQVLCTGSLHLIGGILGLIDPEMVEHKS